jgi:hypothetical protein
MTVVLPCHHCKTPPNDASDEWHYALVCNNCFDADCVGDPAEYTTRSVIGEGYTRAEAIDDWNEKTQEKMP